MAKEITKAIILQEIQDKFKLRDYTPEKFLFNETVVPTYEITNHLTHTTATYKEVSVTSGPETYLFFTVPPTERWFIDAYNVVFMASGAYKVTGVYVFREKRVSGMSTYLDMTLGQTVSYAVNLPKLLRMDPGDRLYVYVDDYTSTAALRLYIDYTREEIR